jgi:hypothetical protein
MRPWTDRPATAVDEEAVMQRGSKSAPGGEARPIGPSGPAEPGRAGGPGGKPAAAKRAPSRWRRRRRRAWQALLAVFIVVFGYVAVTMYPYLTEPGSDSNSARAAEWARDHHLGSVVTWLENETYKAPPTGGKLDPKQLAQLNGPTAAPRGTAAAYLPPDITPLAAGPLPGEGVWHPVATGPGGTPIIERAALRPDAQHTSQLAYVAWMDQSALSFTLHPGYQQPGGTWSTPDSITHAELAGLLATWNGGFKVKPDDALAGYYADGRTAVPLVAGKASEVFYRDGSMKIGSWGAEETMTSEVTGVRQNLSLLVDQGTVTVTQGDGSSSQWGYTIKNSYFVARSGVGMTARGDIVYVGGSALSVYTLAELLKAAGAVEGMELDINPDWVSFMSYSGSAAKPAPDKLWDFSQPANRYFLPSDRDFVAVYAR